MSLTSPRVHCSIRQIRFLRDDTKFFLADNGGNLGLFQVAQPPVAHLLLANPFSADALEKGSFRMELHHEAGEGPIKAFLEQAMSNAQQTADKLAEAVLANFVLGEIYQKRN